MRIAKCRSCGADIVWAFTGNGKKMPLDAEPLSGLFEIIDDGRGEVRAMYSDDQYRSHFASCPDADSWRKDD